MTNLLPTIVPKSDQLNADDLIGRSLTIKVSRVALSGADDQPIAIHYEGDQGKPYKPCKSMRRVMVHVWGSDGNAYVGRRMTLYRDDTVRFGGVDVGGIRISHMSDIDKAVTMALTATRANRKPFTVRPMGAERPADRAGATAAADLASVLLDGRKAAMQGELALQAWWKGLTAAQKVAAKPTLDAELKPLAQGKIAGAEPGYDDPADGGDPAPTFSDEEVEAGEDAFPGDRPTLPAGMKTGADLLREQAGALEDLPQRMAEIWDRITADLQSAEWMDDVEAIWKRAGEFRAQLSVRAPNRIKAIQAKYNERLEALS